jgi:hypothetical protein
VNTLLFKALNKLLFLHVYKNCLISKPHYLAKKLILAQNGCSIKTLFYTVIQGTLSITRPKLNDTDEYRLIQMLFGGYNVSAVRPVKNSSNPVQVEFEMKLSRLVKVVS